MDMRTRSLSTYLVISIKRGLHVSKGQGSGGWTFDLREIAGLFFREQSEIATAASVVELGL